MQSVIDLGSGQARGANQLEEAALRLRSGHGGRVGGLGDGSERSRTAVPGIAGEEGGEPVASEKIEDLGLLGGGGGPRPGRRRGGGGGGRRGGRDRAGGGRGGCPGPQGAWGRRGARAGER